MSNSNTESLRKTKLGDLPERRFGTFSGRSTSAGPGQSGFVESLNRSSQSRETGPNFCERVLQHRQQQRQGCDGLR